MDMETVPQAGIREQQMRCLMVALLAIVIASPALAQQDQTQSSRVGSGASAFSQGTDQPIAKIGKDDLLGISVYDEPELTRPVRVDFDGDIRLPMVKEHIPVAGLYPAEVETVITKVLVADNVMVDPIVTVSVLEYRSRSITITGAVKTPTSFQAAGTVTLLDALSRAGGLADNAGSEILVSHQAPGTGDKPVVLIQRIPAQALINAEDPSLNLVLEGGDDIRVPEAGRVFVLGRVKHPGAYFITDGSESSVMKALSLSEGLDSFPSHKAYIYRVEGGTGGRSEIPIDLKKIMARKSPDVALMPNDILYIPDAAGARAGMAVLATAVGLSVGAASVAVYASHY